MKSIWTILDHERVVLKKNSCKLVMFSQYLIQFWFFLYFRYKKEEGDDSDIPEIHFPASGDGDGVDELQPSLEPEFQMLEMLEQEVQAIPWLLSLYLAVRSFFKCKQS